MQPWPWCSMLPHDAPALIGPHEVIPLELPYADACHCVE